MIDDQEVNGYGNSTIAVVLPPFHPRSRSSPANFAPHDPARARAFAQSFPTVEAVLEELPLTNAIPRSPWTRTDLDVVFVGCWGGVTAVCDFALVDDGLDGAILWDVTSALAQRHPEARVVGSAHVDRGATHEETAVHLPGGLTLHTEGWSLADECYVDGDPHAIARELGLSAEALAEAGIDLDEEPLGVPWEHFGRQLLDPHDPWGFAELRMSAFRVRHTEKATYHMEEIWLGGD
ncbi:DUF6333 family protein [Saccharothrix coeruleofusca]|uniref:DUF6333 family protein n=1 Tax=Saccharothrix coeruleofusca TaxID=33919 RepID=UPI0016712C37|nr:DUF6333 family protein [Saccharothrix coeruleofusca]